MSSKRMTTELSVLVCVHASIRLAWFSQKPIGTLDNAMLSLPSHAFQRGRSIRYDMIDMIKDVIADMIREKDSRYDTRKRVKS